MPSYLLPCKCGRRLPVTAVQAGDQLECECGERIEVPTLRHLASLERLEEAPQRGEKSWGLRQALVFLGTAIVALAVVAIVGLHFTKPQPIREPILRTAIEKMTPPELWNSWVVLQQGIRRPLTPYEAAVLQQNQFQIRAWEVGQIAALVLAAIGGLLVILGFSLRRSPRRLKVPARS